jgi:hypothetical protein
LERHARAGIFLQGFAKGGNGFCEPRRPALPLAERCERTAEIQGFAIGGNGLLEPRRG